MDRKTDPHAIYMLLLSLTMLSLSSTYWALDMYNLLASVWDAVDGAAVAVHLSSGTGEDAMSLELAQQSVACAIVRQPINLLRCKLSKAC